MRQKRNVMHTSRTEDSQEPDMKKKYKKSVSKKGNFQFCNVKKIAFKLKKTLNKCVKKRKPKMNKDHG